MKKRTSRTSARRPAAGSRANQLIVELGGKRPAAALKPRRLCDAVRAVLRGEGIGQANISLAVVDDRTIHDLNRQYLKHDMPTDVISFVLEQSDGIVDGQIVVSTDTAATAAKRYGWSAADELLLYVVHGTLHLAGYDDQTPHARRTMRRLERRYLAEFGIEPQYREGRSREKRTSKHE